MNHSSVARKERLDKRKIFELLMMENVVSSSSTSKLAKVYVPNNVSRNWQCKEND